MNAFSNLEAAKNELHYYDLVYRSIYGLLPLREDRRKTEEYFNRYLFADARLHEAGDGALWEDEVNPALAPAVRLEILRVISVDDSFDTARDIITRSDHRYHQPDDYNSILHDPPLAHVYICATASARRRWFHFLRKEVTMTQVDLTEWDDWIDGQDVLTKMHISSCRHHPHHPAAVVAAFQVNFLFF